MARPERWYSALGRVGVPETWTSFPGNVLGVTGKHLQALQHAEPPIKYEPAKKAHLNGQKPPLQSK